MNHIDRVGGLGSNNIMSLWTWPWTQSRKLLKGQRNNKQKPLPDNNVTLRILNLGKYVLLAGIIVALLFWQHDYDDLWDVDIGLLKAEKKLADDGLSMAVLVAGSTQRFLFDSFVKHVVQSSSTTSDPVRIDYFAILSLQQGAAFRQGLGYMAHLAGRDELFDGVLATTESSPVDTVQEKMLSIMKNAVKSVSTKNFAAIQALRLLDEPIEDDPVLDIARKREQNRTKPTDGDAEFDFFQQYPMMDLRQKALVRTAAGNKNIIRLFLSLESLWKNEFLTHEKQQRYDYVLILRDDTLWLDDFDLHKIIATDPTADAYILSCDARDPLMLPPEINDHGILVKREKADILGAYVTAMVNSDLHKCHASVEEWLGKDRGCNSEMILRFLLESNNVKVKLVPQSVFPFERSVLIDGKSSGDDKNFYCLHKFCQSVDAPLEIPSNIESCKKLTFDEEEKK